MKRSVAVLGAVSLFAWTAAAQDVPRAEVFTGFTYTRVNSASNVPAFSTNGGGGGDNNQHCIRYTTGFNFTLGAQ